MAKSITLPLSEMQLLQKEFAKKQKRIKRDPSVDKELCLAYQQGDKSAGVKLIYRYLDNLSEIYRAPTRTKNRGGVKCKIDIHSSTTKEDFEDIFQEIIYYFLELLLEYDPAEGDLQGLIVGKLHLRFFYYYYGDLVDIRMNEDELDDNYDMEEEIKEIFLDDEREVPKNIRQMYLAISDLTPNQREVLDKSVAKGWTSPEIAKEMNVSDNYIRKEKKKVLQILRQKLMEAI